VSVGYSREVLEHFFTDVQDAGTVTNAEGLHNHEFGNPIFVCRGQRMPWAQIWPQIKTFD